MVDDSDRLSDAGAQTLRRHWFTYLDTIEPERNTLHAYCRRLTANRWDAEDLVQDSLLRGFAMTARGDFHGPDSPVRDRRAYLLRTATNLWLDQQRRGRWRGTLAEADEPAAPDPDPAATGEALARMAVVTSAREFAAILLKDVYDFSLEDIADFVGTTVGTVKSALSRARRKVAMNTGTPAPDDAARALARALADAMNARDVDRLLDLMAESVKIDVCNVGGGRGRRGIWTEKTLAGHRFEYAELEGAALVLLFPDDVGAVCNRDPDYVGADSNRDPGGVRVLSGVIRVEGEGAATRLVDYHYAPETLSGVAEALGLEWVTRGYHQRATSLPDMIATTALPWRGS